MLLLLLIGYLLRRLLADVLKALVERTPDGNSTVPRISTYYLRVLVAVLLLVAMV